MDDRVNEWTTTCPDCGAPFAELVGDHAIAAPRWSVRCQRGHEHAVAEGVRDGDDLRFRLSTGPPPEREGDTMVAKLPAGGGARP